MTAAGVNATDPATAAPRGRLRGDLQIRSRDRSGRRQYWVLHPITGQVVRLFHRDFAVLHGAHDRRGPDALLYSEAVAAGLIAGRAGAAAGRSPVRWWRNPLCIRLPGMPADRVARALASCSGWLFSPWAVGLWCAFVAAMVIGVIGRGGRLAASFDALATFQASHWAIVLGTLVVTKVVHELAHATVCRRMGAAVREIGVLLLCGTPCLYCDVTDSWRVESRARRAAIMLAGVYVEVVIAAIAALLWMTSGSAWLRMMTLNVMMVCGVSTLLFNLNPLMRYDGYFVLADFLDVPNLRTRAAEAWRWGVVRPLAGAAYQTVAVEASRRSVWAFVAYHVGSTVYRYVVLGALGGWCYVVISRAGLEPVGRGTVVLAVLALAAGGVRKVRAMASGRGGWAHVPRLRRWILAGAAITAALGLLFVPVHRRVTAHGVVHLHGAVNIYIPRSGRIERVHCDYGTTVRRGDLIAQLDEPSVRLEHLRLEARSGQLRIRQASLKRRSLDHPEMLEQLEGQAAAMRATENQLQSVEAALQEMTLVAPRDGIVLPVLDNEAPTEHEELPRRMSDSLGRSVQQGLIWCCIGDEASKQVLLQVDASRRRLVEVGSRVHVQIDQSPGEVVSCEVAAVSAMRHDRPTAAEREDADRFIIACRLPPEVARRVRIGTTATGVIRGEPVRVWDWCHRRLKTAF